MRQLNSRAAILLLGARLLLPPTASAAQPHAPSDAPSHAPSDTPLNAPADVAPPKPDALSVTFRTESGERTVSGRLYAQDSQGGLCVLQEDGQLVIVEASELVESVPLRRPFEPLSADALAERLAEELGGGFQVYTTPHYVVAYSTSREYARWLSSMLERLHKAFVGYWEKEGLELSEPEFPLVVLVYADEASFRRASAEELRGAGGVIGYYNLQSNRVSMYDLTGLEQLRSSAGGRTTMRDINRMVAQPAVAPLVATIVHEATHQVAFNTGVMQRFADLPMWLVEGMAIYFEAPDLSTGRGWRGIGKVNYPRLQTFRANAPRWSAESLTALVTDDQRFRQSDVALAAYADAWALNYFLIKHRPQEYLSYVRHASAQAPFVTAPEGGRLARFEEHFGDADELNQEFFRTMLRVD